MEHIFTESNFESEVLKSEVPVLVDFWASWCEPCRRMGPIVDAVANEVDSSKFKVGKCNVDENGQLAQTYGIMSIPSFLIFKNGSVAETLVGSMSKQVLLDKVMKHVA